MQERRSFVRLAWRAAVETMKVGPSHEIICEGVMKNLSREGFAFLSEDTLQRGLTYHFKIEQYGSPIDCQGTVVHVHKMDSYFFYGIRFKDLPFGQRLGLNKLLSAQSPELRRKFFIYSFIGGALTGLLVKFLFGGTTAVALSVGFIIFFLLYIIAPF